MQVPWQFKLPPTAKEAAKHSVEIKDAAAKLGTVSAARDEFILRTFSLTPHFLAVHLPFDWKKNGMFNDPMRITIPFCPTRNMTQRLLRAMGGSFDEVSNPESMVASEERQSRQSRLVEAMKEYADLLSERLKLADV